MNKELKLRLILFIIGAFLIGSAYFLSGDWRDEPAKGGGFHPGEPIFEKDLITESCGVNCIFVRLDTTLLLGMIGLMIGMGSIVPIRWTEDINVLEDER